MSEKEKMMIRIFEENIQKTRSTLEVNGWLVNIDKGVNFKKG